MPKLHRFHPRLFDSLQGYTRGAFAKDVGAGITVGIVALPMAMAFAIASGLTPQAGLWTAIIAGFLIASLGGSNIQIGGPAGAFIVIVYGIVERYGLPNLLIATVLAGGLLFAMGLFKLGTLVRYVPVSVIIGFTNGIAVLVALSQLKDMLGLKVAGKMPADFFSLLATLWQALPSYNLYAMALAALCVSGLVLWPRVWKDDSPVMRVLDVPVTHGTLKTAARVPGPIIALLSLSLLAYLLQLPVETIGSKFGGIAQDLPTWRWPSFSWASAKLLVTPTLTLALLGAIESLLCARIGDQAANQFASLDSKLPAHDPNQELMAQGVANMVVPFLGGMPVTGTIARTVTNARAGATTPVAGIVHALVLATIVLVAAPLAVHIPLAVLAGILLFVAWNMGEWREFAQLKSFSNHYRLIVLGTFLLTVVVDLTVALEIGMALACILFVRRMGTLFSVQVQPPDDLAQENVSKNSGSDHTTSYVLRGALFFGAVIKMDVVLQHIEATPSLRLVQFDCHQLLALDTSGADILAHIVHAMHARGGQVRLLGLQEQPKSLVARVGLREKVLIA